MTKSKNLNHVSDNKKNGFTLIEILVVVAIIGILATLITISVVGSQRKARDTKRTADTSSMMTALGQYKENSGIYPLPCGPTSTFCQFTGTALEPYLGALPKDPKTKAGYLYETKDTNYQIYVTYESDKKGGVTNTSVPTAISIGTDLSSYFICRVGSDTSKYSDEASNNTPVCK